MFLEKIEQLIALLEKQELESTNGVVSLQLYSELFAAYLYKNDLCNARFLWKRIPNNVKEGNKELEQMHQVFKCLWNNNMVQFNEAINFEWSRDVAELMFELKEKVHLENINLIGRSYSSIYENVFAEMTNQTPEMVEQTCKNLNWEIIDGPSPRLIIPKKPIVDKMKTPSHETQLLKLTEFISFLEN